MLSLNIEEGLLDLVGYKNTTRRTMAIAVKDNYIYSVEWASVQIFEFGDISGADIDLSTYELNYPFVDNGNSETLSVNVINNGGETLIVSDNYTTNSEFNVINPLTTLEPGEKGVINLGDADTLNSVIKGNELEDLLEGLFSALDSFANLLSKVTGMEQINVAANKLITSWPVIPEKPNNIAPEEPVKLV